MDGTKNLIVLGLNAVIYLNIMLLVRYSNKSQHVTSLMVHGMLHNVLCFFVNPIIFKILVSAIDKNNDFH